MREVLVVAVLCGVAGSVRAGDAPPAPAAAPDPEAQAALARADSLSAQVEELYGKRSYAPAIPLAREALAIREKALGKDHPDVARILGSLGLLLKCRGVLAEARQCFERAIGICERAYGEDDPRVATALENLAFLFWSRGAYAEARPLFERELAIREKALGREDRLVGESLANLGMVLEAQGAYAEARPLVERALAILERTLGPGHPDVATMLGHLALLLEDQGAYDEAKPLLERALSIREAALGKDHRDVADDLNGLALLLFHQGAYAEARALLERALSILDRTVGNGDRRLPTVLNSLALVLQAQGAYAEALPLLERALQIGEKAFGKDAPHVATALNNLGSLLQAQGAYAEAKPLYERARAINEKALGKDHPSVATDLNNFAGLLDAEGAYAEAKPLLERALGILEAARGKDHPDVATCLNNLGSLLLKQGAYAEAKPLLDRALSIREAALGKDHHDVAVSLNSLAQLLKAQGAYAEAKPLLERALEINEKALGSDHPSVALCLANLAGLLQAQGAYALERPLLERALAATFASLRGQFGGLGAQERVGFLGTVRYHLANWLEFAPRLGLTGYAEAIRFKGIVSRANEAERRLMRGGSVAESRAEALRAAERTVAQLAGQIPAGRDVEAGARWKERYARAVARREELSRALTREFAGYRKALERFDLGPKEIQARLGEGDALVDFLLVKDRYLAFVLRREGEAVRVDLGAAPAIESAASAFADAAASLAEQAAFDAAGRALFDLVVAPLRAALGLGVARLVICPDAALATVPFAALPGREPGRTLGDGVRLALVAMAQDLVPRERVAPGEGVLAVGAVDYGSAATDERQPAAAELPLLASLSRAPRGSDFVPLAATRAEAEVAAAAVGDGHVLLTAREATEARVRAEARGKRVLHLATHGFVYDDLMRGLFRSDKERGAGLDATLERQIAAGHNPMVLAGLALAGANPRKGGFGDDGILTALEASYLDLDRCDLAVLSACQTALGHAEAGEGVVGLVQAFRMAGARQVLGSLWKVDDEATSALIREFYARWAPKDGSKPMGAAAALKSAQEYIRSQEKWKHPYYWAAWVLWGLPD